MKGSDRRFDNEESQGEADSIAAGSPGVAAYPVFLMVKLLEPSKCPFIPAIVNVISVKLP